MSNSRRMERAPVFDIHTSAFKTARIMTEPLMIGTRGWEHAAWRGGFYPPELPDDWRFCYYSNNLRSVLVPRDRWPETNARELAQWIEDSDPEFRFVLELPAALGRPLAPPRADQELGAFLARVAPLAARTAGLVWQIADDAPVSTDWFEPLLNRLARHAPVCVDLPGGEWRAPPQLSILDRQGAGLVWHCQREDTPRPGGGLLVALAPVADARTVRHRIERLAQWQGHHHAARAGLMFEPSAQSAKAAQEARLIAELMGV
jgi:uncharacterized protein YecE (DUF72 family)